MRRLFELRAQRSACGRNRGWIKGEAVPRMNKRPRVVETPTAQLGPVVKCCSFGGALSEVAVSSAGSRTATAGWLSGMMDCLFGGCSFPNSVKIQPKSDKIKQTNKQTKWSGSRVGLVGGGSWRWR